MIVVGASEAVSTLLSASPARQALSEQQIHASHLIDIEVVSAFRHHVTNRHVDASTAWSVLDRWRRLAVACYPVVRLMERIWGLRQAVCAYKDAT